MEKIVSKCYDLIVPLISHDMVLQLRGCDHLTLLKVRRNPVLVHFSILQITRSKT
ncbi:hypothetical protein J6590_100387, partial [Homalodisca vitripennis]